MNAKTMLGEIALAVWRLSEAERHERAAANHRREAAAILGKAHADSSTALVAAQMQSGRARRPGNGLEQDAPATFKNSENHHENAMQTTRLQRSARQ